MKAVSWNVNGIRAAWGHGLSAFLDDSDADIYAFQETRTDEAIPMIEKEGYHAYWSFCGKKKGYSGTLCLTKKEPLNVRYDMGNANFDTEGRIITLEFEDFFFVNCYVPNSQRSEKRHDYRRTWDSKGLFETQGFQTRIEWRFTARHLQGDNQTVINCFCKKHFKKSAVRLI